MFSTHWGLRKNIFFYKNKKYKTFFCTSYQHCVFLGPTECIAGCVIFIVLLYNCTNYQTGSTVLLRWKRFLGSIFLQSKADTLEIVSYICTIIYPTVKKKFSIKQHKTLQLCGMAGVSIFPAILPPGVNGGHVLFVTQEELFI